MRGREGLWQEGRIVPFFVVVSQDRVHVSHHVSHHAVFASIPSVLQVHKRRVYAVVPLPACRLLIPKSLPVDCTSRINTTTTSVYAV